MDAYQAAFGEYWRRHDRDYADSLNVHYFFSNAFPEARERASSEVMPFVALAMLLMLLFLMTTLGRLTCVSARTWLAFTALLIMLCAVIVGFSVSLCLGAERNSIVPLVVFILLGVGVDDMS